jgi:hypothetical protein
MNKYLLTILASFICLWLNQAASNADKIKVRNGINSIFNEPNQSNYINVATLPIAELIANTNVSGYFLVIDERQLDNLAVPLNRRTLTYLDNWRDTNLANPNHLKWDKGASWEQVLADNGLRLRVSTNGVPK